MVSIMGLYSFTTDINREDYDNFVKHHEYCNLLQSYSWASVKSNWDHIHTAVYDVHHDIVAAGLVLIKKLPMGLTMFYLPRGPIMDYTNQDLLAFYFTELKKIAKKKHCLFIKFDPAIHVNDYTTKDYNENRYASCAMYLDSFQKVGAIHHGFTMNIADTVQARFQANVYNKEDWETGLPKHTKRLIKDANRRNVEIITGHAELVDEFSRLVNLTEERKQVHLRDKEYFNLLMDTYQDDAVILLAMCNVYELAENAKMREKDCLEQLEQLPEHAKKKKRRLEDQLNSCRKDLVEFNEVLDEIGHEDKQLAIAGILSIQYGNTCEMLYAGMDERFKKFMPQYKEYVENFRWAFDRGCIWANMGGVEGDLKDGLTKFKDNFNPMINELIGEFDIPVNKLLYNASQKAYNFLRNRNK